MGDVADRFLGASPNASALRRMTSTSARRTTTFSDFLSDSDGSDDSDGDGAARMQQQADDMTYIEDLAFGAGSPDDLGPLGASPEDRSFRLSVAPAPPTTAVATPTRETTTTTTRKTVGRLTAVRAPSMLRRLTSLKTRKKKTKKAQQTTDARGTLSDVNGVILDSDEDASERSSQADADDVGGGATRHSVDDQLSVYSEHDSSFGTSYAAPRRPSVASSQGSDDRSFTNGHDHSFASIHGGNDHSFVSHEGDNDHSFASSHGGNDHSFASSHGGNDHSFFSHQGDNDHSFASSHGGNDHSFASSHGDNDHSFGSSHGGNDDSFVGGHNDDSFYAAQAPYGDDGNVDDSFSSAMVVRPRHSDEDEGEDLYDSGGYDAEEEELRRRDKEARVREQEQEERESQRYQAYRLSEEPFSQIARASARISAAVGFGELEDNPYKSTSFDSVSSSENQFFVESVRGSSDSIAPIMDLGASPAQFSEISSGSGSANNSLSSTPASLLARQSADLSFRTSFVAVTHQEIPSTTPPVSVLPPAPPTLGFRVRDHTQKRDAPAAAGMASTLDDRHSSSSSSSLSSSSSVDNTSFSSNIDDSFTQRPRTSSEEDISFVFSKHVMTSVGGDDPVAQADAIAAVEDTAADRSLGPEDNSFASSAVPLAVESKIVPAASATEALKVTAPLQPLPQSSVAKDPVPPSNGTTIKPTPKETPPMLIGSSAASPKAQQPSPPSEPLPKPTPSVGVLSLPSADPPQTTSSQLKTLPAKPAVEVTATKPSSVKETSAPVEATPTPVKATQASVKAATAPIDVVPAIVKVDTVPVQAVPAPLKAAPVPVKATPAPVKATPFESSSFEKSPQKQTAPKTVVSKPTAPKETTAVLAPPVIAKKAPPAVENTTQAVATDNSAVEPRKTKKFSRPLPPGRKRGPPVGAATAVAAVASTAVAATASIVNAVTASSSPPKPLADIDKSIVSPRASDAGLDFTGVFLGEAEDSQRSRKAIPTVESKKEQSDNAKEPEPEAPVKEMAAAAAKAGPPTVRRIVSAQVVSERKVEEYFRKTYLQNEDDDMSDFMLQSGNMTRGRSKTAANRGMANATSDSKIRDDPLLISNRSRRSSTSAMMMVDLKHIKGQRIEELLRANEEETKDDDEEAYSDLAGSEAPARKRTLSRPSARFPINEDLLEVKYPLRPSTASSIALASRKPAPPKPNEAPLTPMTVYSVNSGSEDAYSVTDSETPLVGNVIQRNFTLSLASGTVGRSSFSVSPNTEGSPNEIPMPPNYMLSPRLKNHRPSSSLGSISSDGDSVFDQSGASTQQLPTLNTRTVKAAAGAGGVAASAKLANSGVGVSQFASSMMRSPNPMAASTGVNAVAPGFRWHPELSQNQPPQQSTQQLYAPGTKQSHESNWSSDDGSVAMKESVWHAAGALSIGSARPSMAASVASHIQRASATVKNSFQRMRSQFVPPNRGNNEVTSPKSIVSAPPQLPRGFDDRQFYRQLGNIACGDAMIVVNKAVRGNAAKESAIAQKRRTQAWLLLLGTLFGIVMGVGMTQIESLASHFKVLVNDVTGEMTLPNATKWLLLPGSLFLRIWNCVAMPLLFCQVVNGIAELAMTHKANSALSLRTAMYLVLIATLTSIEGVGLALVYHTLGLFAGNQVALRVEAASVKSTINVLDRVKGMAAMVCAAGESYLQASEGLTSWKCSNETIPLPVQKGINVTSKGWFNSSSAAIFAFQEMPTTLSAATSSVSAASTSTYYAATTSSVGDVIGEVITLLSPKNVVDSFSKSLAPSIVAVALIFGLVIGMRAWHRSITAQHFLHQSQTQPRTQATVLAESILAKPHPVLGIVVEVQQLLEWLTEVVQCFAPFGVASLLAGHIVMHRDEWFVIPAPVFSLIIGVVLASLIHIVVLSPLLVKLVTGVNAWKSLTSFLPSMCLSFGTGNVVLSVPLLAQNFASAQVVTKSMSQVSVGLAVAVQRSGNALYYPLVMLFLLETTTPDGAVPMTAKFALVLGMLAFVSCFFAVSVGPKLGLPGVTASAHLQLALVVFRAWTKQQLLGTATMPLLVAADIVLGRVVAMVTTNDHVTFARLLGEHCAELCVAPSETSLGMGASPVYL